MKNNLWVTFRDTALARTEDVAVTYKKDGVWRRMDYGALKKNIDALSCFLLAQGISKGDRVAIMLKNAEHWPIIFFAVLSRGAVAVPINFEAGEQETQNILENSRSRIVFVHQNSFLLKDGRPDALSFIEKIVNIDSGALEDIFSSDSGRDTTGEDCAQKDLACILYTSGTTGVPKGVMLSHGNFLSNCQSIHQLKIITDSDSVVSFLPLHHAYPLTATLILPLLYGAKIVYPVSIKSEDISEAMQKANPSVFVGVPQFFHALEKKIQGQLDHVLFPFNLVIRLVIAIAYQIRKSTGFNASRFFLASLHRKFGTSMRLFVNGGAKLNEEVSTKLLQWGFVLSEGYGLSETSPVLTVNPPQRFRIGSAGLPIPGVELKIDHPNENGVGEVIARGPNVMQGYYQREDLTQQVIAHGWFQTGDLGFFDKDGYLFLTGRSKDVIVLSSGLNIDPQEVEEKYIQAVPIKEMCVFEAPSLKASPSDLVLWAVVRPDLDFFKKYGEVNLYHVIKERFDNVSRTQPAHNRLMGFSITLDELPKTALGKLKRFEIKDKYMPKTAQEKKTSQKKVQSDEDNKILQLPYAQKIIKQIRQRFNIKEDICLSDSLELDLGIDSLGRIELISAMEEALGVDIPEEVIGKAFTVKDLIFESETFLHGQQGMSVCVPKTLDRRNYWKKILEVFPSKEKLEKIDLQPGAFSWIVGFLLLIPFYLFFKIFYRLRVTGQKNVTHINRHILYANHTSYFDGLVIGVGLPRFPKLDMFFIGFRPYFNVVIIRNLIRIGRIIPIDFSSHFTEALRSCYYVLNNEKNLCIFPEGLRTLDGQVTDFKKGFGILAKEAGVKLVPVLIEGAYEAWPRTSTWPRLHPIKVTFGKPFDVKEFERKGTEAGINDPHEAICHAARQALIDLKKEIKEA